MIPERVIYNKEEESAPAPKELKGTKFVLDEPCGQQSLYVVTDIYKGDSLLCCSENGTTRVISTKKINKNSADCPQDGKIFGDAPGTLLEEADKYISEDQTFDELLMHSARLNLALNRLSRTGKDSESAQTELAYAVAEVQLLLSRVQNMEFVQKHYEEAKDNAVRRLSERVEEEKIMR